MKNVGNRYDFAGPFRDRNWTIYRMRVVEKRTLSSIGAQYNISRERVRQIVVRAANLTKHRRWAETVTKTNGLTPVGALNLSARVQKVLNNPFLKNIRLYDLPIRLFVETVTPQEMMEEPTFGRRSLKELIAAIEEVDPDVSNLWTAGHGQNYNPAKHGR